MMDFHVINLAVDGDRTYGSIVENQKPVFSWGAEHSEDGAYQSAYRIVVRTETEQKWDSGWVMDCKQSATYDGAPLYTAEEVFWTVQIKDENGKESATGEHFFVMALTEQWDAPWITTPWDVERETKYFQKQFDITKQIKKAYLYVCGIGYQDVTLNGQRVDEAYLQPAVSNYAKHCYYVTLPVKEYLREGENALEIAVGEGWRRNYGEYLNQITREVEFFGVPKLTAQLQIEYADESSDHTAHFEA